jgi:hypothetical protein
MSLIEKEISMQTFLIEKLSQLRKRPDLIVSELNTVILSLKNTKMEDKAVDGIRKEITKIQSMKNQSNLSYSEGLSRGAVRQIDNFLNTKEADFTTFSNNSSETLEPVMKNYVKGHGKLYQILDTFSDENRFIQKLFMNMSQKGVTCRGFLFDQNLKNYGVACKKYKNTFIVNIVFTENVQELDIYNFDDELAEKINDLRVKNSSVFDHYSNTYKKILDAVPGFNSEQVEKFYKLLEQKKKLQPLQKEPVLDNLANELLIHSSENDDVKLENHKDGVYIPDQERLEGICQRFITGFNECEAFIVQGEPGNVFDLLEKILFTGRKHKEGNDNLDIILANENFQNIGVVYEERVNLKDPTKKHAIVCCLFMDEFSHQPKTSYVDLICEEFSRLRKDPKSFRKDVDAFLSKHKFKYGKDLPEVLERIKLTLRNLESMPELVSDRNLNNAAIEYSEFIQNEKNTHFYEEDDEELNIRIRHYLENPKLVSQVVNYANFNPTDMVISLLVKEFTKDPSKPNHSNILSRQFKYFGVSEKFLREKSLFCVILTDNNKQKMIHDKKFKDDLIEDLQNIRKYPRMYMKYVNLPNGETYNPFMRITKTSSNEEILLDFLGSTRGYGKMIQENGLEEACQKYLFERINENEDTADYSKNSKTAALINKLTSDKNVRLKVEDKDFLTKFLKPMGDGFNRVFNIVVNNEENLKNKLRVEAGEENRGNLDSKNFVIDIALNKTFRDNLFNSGTKFFGISTHIDRKIVLGIFTDAFNCQREVIDYTKTYQGKAPRPDLLEDEIDQIRKDYMRLDVNQTDIMFPSLICKIFEENNLIGDNFIYYQALLKFCGEFPEAAEKGIDMNKFVGIVREFMSVFTGKEWVTTFNILKEKSRNSLESIQFNRLLNEVNFRCTEEESNELFRNVCLPESEQSLTQRNFCSIMDNMTNNAEKVKRLHEYNGKISPTNNKNSLSTRNSFKTPITKL